MDVFRIEGPVRLQGNVEVNGSKNAALPIMAAAILAPGESVLMGVPNLSDISVCGELLAELGCKVARGTDGSCGTLHSGSAAMEAADRSLRARSIRRSGPADSSSHLSSSIAREAGPA